jgi:hypothetical protein
MIKDEDHKTDCWLEDKFGSTRKGNESKARSEPKFDRE